jgi:cytochrome c-type biogenesis protein
MLTAFAIGNLSAFLKKFSRYFPVVSIISGILMVIMGLLMFTNKLTVISGYLKFINF